METFRIATVELETVHMEPVRKGDEFVSEFLPDVFPGEVHRNADAVPPPDQGRVGRIVPAMDQNIHHPGLVAGEFRATVGRKEVRTPNHALVAVATDLVEKMLPIREGVGVEVPATVIALPTTVNHHHAAGEAASVEGIYELFRILLIDAKHHRLNPVVELRLGEHQLCRLTSLKGKMSGTGCEISLSKGFPCLDWLQFFILGVNTQYTGLERKAERMVAPQIASPVGNKERCRHALDTHRAEIEGRLIPPARRRLGIIQEKVVPGTELRERLNITFVDDGAPPTFSVQRFDYGFVPFLLAGKEEDQKSEERPRPAVTVIHRIYHSGLDSTKAKKRSGVLSMSSFTEAAMIRVVNDGIGEEMSRIVPPVSSISGNCRVS